MTTVKKADEAKTPAVIKAPAKVKSDAPQKDLLNLLRRAFDIAVQNDDGWVHLGALGNAYHIADCPTVNEVHLPASVGFLAIAIRQCEMIKHMPHHPMCIELDKRLLLNPDSLYGNRNRPERTCAILPLPDCTFILYDIDTGKP